MRLRGEELAVSTVRDLVIARAVHGDRPLLHLRGETLTYQEAHLRSNRFANALAGWGVGRGDVVTTYLSNSVDHLCIWFACAKLGAIWAPLNIALVNQDLLYSVADAAGRVLVVDEELLPRYRQVRPHLQPRPVEVLWGDPATAVREGLVPFDRLREGSDALPDARVSPTDPLAITYTGGSTGMPKGVLLPHIYYIATALRYRDTAQPTPADVHLSNGQLFHVGGQQLGVLGPMFCHMSTVMVKWFSASGYWDLARQYGATVIDPVGPMLAALMQQPPRPGDREHGVRLGLGVATGQVRREIRDGFEERFGLPLLEVYAQTETGCLLCTETVTDRRPGSSGKSGWAQFRIVDEEDQELPRGQVGEILIRPLEPHCFMLEYYNKPAQTVNAWRNLWFHSGDLGRLDEDGYLYFVGRQAHWIRRRGENVSAFEVEKVIAAHPAVADCAVVGVPAELGDEDVKAYVQLSDPAVDLDPLAIVQWCEERIAYFKVPRYVQFVPDLPRSVTKNEIERHKLRDGGAGEAWDREQAGYKLRRKP